MQKLIQSLLSPRAVAILLVAVLVLAIYFVGDLSYIDRFYLHIAAAVVVVASLAIAVVQRLGAAKSANALESALRAQGQAQLGGTRPDQRASIEELKGQFEESLELLRKSKMGRGALHSIPWYVLVGPPGSGKSTLLRQSGLSFPYMTKGRSAIRGLGGTKNCDWWFADRGILLDTAGRFMTEAEDREEWMAFLRMIKKGRKHRPINGAIVAVGIPEVLEGSEKELQATAENVRDRIDELTRELGAVFPIYLVFTKCDRLRGFVETFDTLNKDQRKQVWGFTFPFSRGKEFVVADQFGKEFDELYRSLCVRRIDLLASDHFKKRKAQVYAFPMQFLRVKERLQSFLGQLQAENPYQEASPIRGVYFTSGTQEGTTIDRILKVVRPAELEHDVPEDSRRCYFVDDLFNSVVFDDAALASPSARSAQRAQWLRLGTAIAIGIASLAVVVMDWSKRSAFGAEVEKVTATIVADGEPAKVAAALDAQLGMLGGDNQHIANSGVLPTLKSHYLRSLASFASKKIDAHVTAQAKQAVLPLEDAGRPAYATVKSASETLQGLHAGIEAFRERAEGSRAAAQELWKAAIADSLAVAGHFDQLFAARSADLRIEGASVALANARAQVTKHLGTELRADLEESHALAPQVLFPGAWSRLHDTSGRFGDCSLIVMDPWHPDLRTFEWKGPLWSRECAAPNAAHLEGLLEKLEQDLAVAKQRKGSRSGQLIRELPGSTWDTYLGTQRELFLGLVDAQFEANWSALLKALTRAATEGRECDGAEDTFGSTRLVAVPELVWCHKLASKVLEGRQPLTAEALELYKKELVDLKARQKAPGDEWARRPGVVRAAAALASIPVRATAASDWLTQQQRRVEALDWQLPKLRGDLVGLELALVRALVLREWSACRAEVVQHATVALFPAWDALHKAYPFQPDAAQHADARLLEAALKPMFELADVIGKLAPADQFGLDAGFQEDLEASRRLRRLLYNADEVRSVPEIQVSVRLQSRGESILGKELRGGDRATEETRAVDWKLGEAETLGLKVAIQGGTELSIRQVVARRGPLPAAVLNEDRLRSGMWNLKRLCDLGEATAKDGRVISTLSLENRPDKLLLVLQCTPPEVEAIFTPAWPGDQYKLSGRIWARQ